MTQTDVANLLNMGQKPYSGYDLGKTGIPLDSMRILAKYYDVSMDYLMEPAIDILTKMPPTKYRSRLSRHIRLIRRFFFFPLSIA